MKRILFVLSLMAWLSACGTPSSSGTPVSVETVIFITPAATQPVFAPTEAIPAGKLPAAPFESETYINGTLGFALDYPSGWTVKEAVVGERGSQVQFLSSPDLADAATVPAGETRLSATVYDWDPKNDLDAYAAHWKSVWSDPGFKILEEEKLVLEQGLPAVQFTVQSPGGATAVFLVTTLGDRYLVLSGEGDLELVKEIVQRVRPISH